MGIRRKKTNTNDKSSESNKKITINSDFVSKLLLPTETKKISVSNSKIIYEGREIDKEKGKEIIISQIRNLENDIEKLLTTNVILDKNSIEFFAERINQTRVLLANSGIPFRGFEELFNVGNDITKAQELCYETLKLFSWKRPKKSIKEQFNEIQNQEASLIEGNQESLEELVDYAYILFLKEIVIREFRKRFSNTKIEFDKNNIYVGGDFYNNFNIVVLANNKIRISFEIFRNNGDYGNLPGDYVGTSLKIGDLYLQNTPDNILKHGNNNFKSARTLENVLIKQIRLLKNMTKQDIEMLEKNISKAQERLEVATLYLNNYNLILEPKLEVKLNKIIEDANFYINNKKITSKTEITTQKQKENKIETIFDINENIKLKITNIIKFILDLNELNIEEIQNKENKTIKYEFQFSSQKVTLLINFNNSIVVKSLHMLGSGQSDIKQMNINGESIFSNIKNASIVSVVPLINRQIDNLSKTIRSKEAKNSYQKIQSILKEITNDLISNKIKYLNNTNIILKNFEQIVENFINLGKDLSDDFFKIIEKLVRCVQIKISTEIYLSKENRTFNTIFFNSNQTALFIYNDSVESGDTVLEGLQEVRKYLYRKLTTTLLLYLLNKYKINVFKNEELNFTEYNELENEIKKLSDDLSEDNIVGGTARRILSLMSSSISSRSDAFKLDIENIIIEIIKIS